MIGRCLCSYTGNLPNQAAHVALGIEKPLFDIRMPDQDGYSLIREIRNLDSKRGGQVSAIALSAYAGVEDRARALSAGFQKYVTKPIDIDEFLAVVAACVVPFSTLVA